MSYDSWLDEPYHEQAEEYAGTVCESCGDQGEAEERDDGQTLCLPCWETEQAYEEVTR